MKDTLHVVQCTFMIISHSVLRMRKVSFEYLPYDTHESVPTQQRERMVVGPVNQYQKL